MKNLDSVQKMFRVFKVLAKIAESICFAGALICAVTLLCTFAWQSGGHVFDISGAPIEPFTDGDFPSVYAKLISLTLKISAGAVLFALVHKYLKHEQSDGTPFTKEGAQELKILGIRCIYIPIIALAASETAAVLLGAENPENSGNLTSMLTGVMLIFSSVVFRYGAELEEKAGTAPSKDCNADPAKNSL